MHYVSTIFTTVGYGGVTPLTFGPNPLLTISFLINIVSLRSLKGLLKTISSLANPPDISRHPLYDFQEGS